MPLLTGSDTRSGEKVCIEIVNNQPLRVGRLSIEGDTRINEYIVQDTNVSASHCFVWSVQFDSSTDRVTYLRDKSLNGTTINGRLVHDAYVILRSGDTIQIGASLQLTFEDEVWETTNMSQDYGWTVFLATKKGGSKYFAVKVSDQPGLDRENSILCKLDHPNIIKVYGLHENYKETYFYQDLAIGGDLFSYLCNGTDTLHPIREPGALFIVFQVAMALEYIHSMGITHRDLKLDNVLIKDVPSRYPHIVLADFGAAQESSFPKLSRPADRMYTMIGTAEYAAPEIKLGLDRSQKGYTNKVDIWSLGIIAHILLSGISPFHDETTEKVFQKVQKAHIDLEIKQWRHISVEAKLFVKGCLRPRVSQRFDIHDCMRSQWINQKGRRKLLDNCYSAVVTNK